MSLKEPSPRYYHHCAAVEGKLYIWRGLGSEDEDVFVYSPLLESWESRSTTGPSPPAGMWGGACTSAGHHLYHYGGYDQHGSGHQVFVACSNLVGCLDVTI